jgi:hypothetical protein
LAVLVSEYRRAIAAERRYEKLKRMATLARDDIPRHLFEEIYACASEGAGEAWVSSVLALQGDPAETATMMKRNLRA